jgi:peptide/nickel transport system substrate-binding protein
VEPLLADSYAMSDDGLTYTFTLKPGVTFHSGKPLTSEDVKFSIERVFAPESQSARKSSSGPSRASRRRPRHRGRDARRPSISFIYNLAYVV